MFAVMKMGMGDVLKIFLSKNRNRKKDGEREVDGGFPPTHPIIVTFCDVICCCYASPGQLWNVECWFDIPIKHFCGHEKNMSMPSCQRFEREVPLCGLTCSTCHARTPEEVVLCCAEAEALGNQVCMYV